MLFCPEITPPLSSEIKQEPRGSRAGGHLEPGDGGFQVHRGQGCVPKVLQQDAGKETGKNSVFAKFCSLYLDFVAYQCLSQVQHMSASDDAEASMISKLKQVLHRMQLRAQDKCRVLLMFCSSGVRV